MLRCEDERYQRSSQLTFGGLLKCSLAMQMSSITLREESESELWSTDVVSHGGCISGWVMSNSSVDDWGLLVAGVMRRSIMQPVLHVVQAMDESGRCTPTVHDAMRRKQRTLGPTAAFHECYRQK